MKNKILLISGILLSIGIYILFMRGGLRIGSSGDLVRIPLSEISEQATWYESRMGNADIRYFAVQASDGTIKTAFDECDVCFRNKKGYRQEGEFMICNNCGNRYPISGLGKENVWGGGCWPGYLPNRVEGEYLIIEVLDLKEGEYRFK